MLSVRSLSSGAFFWSRNVIYIYIFAHRSPSVFLCRIRGELEIVTIQSMPRVRSAARAMGKTKGTNWCRVTVLGLSVLPSFSYVIPSTRRRMKKEAKALWLHSRGVKQPKHERAKRTNDKLLNVSIGAAEWVSLSIHTTESGAWLLERCRETSEKVLIRWVGSGWKTRKHRRSLGAGSVY